MGEQLQLEFNGSTLALFGELDHVSVRNFEEELTKCLDKFDDVIVFDLSHLTFVDACGLTSFLKVERRLRDDDRVLVLRSPRPIVRKLLDVTGLTWLLERPETVVVEN